MSDYHNTTCIICGKTKLMAMTENVICNACEQTSAPADEITKLRAQLKAAAEWYDFPEIGDVYSFQYEGGRNELTITALTENHVMYKLEGDRYVKPMAWELWVTCPDDLRYEK